MQHVHPFTEPPARTPRQQRRAAATRPVPEPSTPAVPLSVWLSEPLAGCCPICTQPLDAACARRLPLGLARQITEAYTRPGDLVFVPDAGNGNALIAPVATGRKVIGYAHDPAHARATSAMLAEQPTEIASLAVLRHSAARDLPGHSQRQAGRAALALLAPHHPAGAADLAPVLDATVRALRPGGIAVIITRQQPGGDRPGKLTAFAQAAGLTYLQHIAAVEATATSGKLRPRTDPTDHGPTCACTTNSTSPARHTLIHNDLLVLSK
jgi:hypothetical protein